MTKHSWIRDLFRAPNRPIRTVRRPRSRVALEELESRIVLTIDRTVALSGTLDINPVSSISGTATRMAVLDTTVPGLTYGTMYRVSSATLIPWGSGPPNPFEPAQAPLLNQNFIFAGEGFEYVNNGTGVGQTESIPVAFSDGFTSSNDTIVIHIVDANSLPTITTQPVGLTEVQTGSVTLSVAASGLGPISYQWYSGLSPNTSSPIAGATSSTYTTPSDLTFGQHMFWVQVSNANGAVSSQTATVQIDLGTSIKASGATTNVDPFTQTITLSANVRGVQGLVNTGTVTFTVDGGLGSVSAPVVNGVATAPMQVPPKTFGQFNLIASYVDPNEPLNNATDTEVLFLTPPPLHFVTTLADFGPGSLRDQISQSNNLLSSGLITFAPGLRGTIVLGSDLPNIHFNVSIQAPSLGAITIDANRNTPFTVNGSLRLFSLIITGAGASGAIFNAGQTQVTGCTFTGNWGLPSSALIINAGGLTMVDCTILNNLQRAGVMNWFSGQMNITNCTFADNTGGGIFVTSGSSAILNNNLFTGNTLLDVEGSVAVSQSHNNLLEKERGSGLGDHDVNGNLVGHPANGVLITLPGIANGNPVWFDPGFGSPVIDAGDTSYALDTKGFPSGSRWARQPASQQRRRGPRRGRVRSRRGHHPSG